mmetsp:Transcript_66503/g.194610  ORF Transcript_66503/g.194610 Transcript_66503/m.194610 type:complete len:204 (-) Transcript_66503:2217-2828(-)
MIDGVLGECEHRHVVICLTQSIEELRVHLIEHLHLFDHGKVLRIVCVEDHLYADLPDILKLVLSQQGKDVGLGHAHKLEEPGAVHVLKRGLVVVPQSKVVGCFYEVDVVHTRVADVVADGAHQEPEALRAAEELLRPTLTQEAVDEVGDIDRMVPVVVEVGLLITTLSSLQEVPHGHGVEGHAVVQLAHEVHCGRLVARPIEL